MLNKLKNVFKTPDVKPAKVYPYEYEVKTDSNVNVNINIKSAIKPNLDNTPLDKLKV